MIVGIANNKKSNKKGRDSRMIDFDITKECRLPVCDSLRTMRIQMNPMDFGSNIFVEDMLEHGYIKLYEYLGGTFYLPANMEEMKHFQKNVVPIVGIKVLIKEEEQVVQVEKIYCEFGYEEFIAQLMKQILNFADFYGLRVSILDLRKDVSSRNIRTCSFVDLKYWG